LGGLSPVAVHTIFDVLAWLSAGFVTIAVVRWRPAAFPASARRGAYYLPILIFSSAIGAYVFGTLNLWASGEAGIARSIEGALAGGIVGVELYKYFNGISGRTAARLAAPIAAGIAVGRVGCYLAGIEDFTYGTPTSLPWGHDFGDGILRHPVQLYESLAMIVFLTGYVVALARQSAFVMTNGFSLMIGFYGLQRFLWEFMKPYGHIAGPFSLFHLVSMALAAYAATLLWRSRGAERSVRLRTN
jgi:phosphatidylglycerol:prolipoprotein diacylglycerol transferase